MANFLGLPPELIDQILLLLSNPSDHLHVALTCQLALFYALPHLYKDVNWHISGTETQEFEPCQQAVGFLLEHPNLWDCVRSLTLSEKRTSETRPTGAVAQFYGPNNVGNAGAGSGVSSEGPLIRRPQRYGDPWFSSVHKATLWAWTTVDKFTHISTLTLYSITLPTNFYHTIRTISPSLRCLTLRSVRLTSCYPTSLGDPFEYNKIEDLTLLQVVQGPYTSVAKIKGVLRLARSHTLRKLRIDRSVELGVDSFIAAGIPTTLHTLICDFRGPMVGTGTNPSRLANLNTNLNVNANGGNANQTIAALNAALHNGLALPPGFAQFAQAHLQFLHAHGHGNINAHFVRRRARKPLVALFRFLHACCSVRELRMTEVGVVNEDAQNAATGGGADGGVGNVPNVFGLGLNANAAEVDADGNGVAPWPLLGNVFFTPTHPGQGLGAALLPNGELNPVVNNVSSPIRLFKSSFPNLKDITAPLSHVRILMHGHIERPLRSVTVSSNVDLDVYGCANSRMLNGESDNLPGVGGGSGAKAGVTYVKLEEIASALRAVHRATIPLEGIRFTLRNWDREVVYMLSEIAQGLREIKVTFASGRADDVRIPF